MTFLDKGGKLIDKYNPMNHRVHEGTKYELQENEELIGVYGVKDLAEYFNSFGFIVKVYR